MRELGPVFWRFTGSNAARGPEYMALARTLLGRTKSYLQGAIGSKTWPLPDGTIIRTLSFAGHGADIIEIVAAGAGAQLLPPPTLRGFVSVPYSSTFPDGLHFELNPPWYPETVFDPLRRPDGSHPLFKYRDWLYSTRYKPSNDTPQFGVYQTYEADTTRRRLQWHAHGLKYGRLSWCNPNDKTLPLISWQGPSDGPKLFSGTTFNMTKSTLSSPDFDNRPAGLHMDQFGPSIFANGVEVIRHNNPAEPIIAAALKRDLTDPAHPKLFIYAIFCIGNDYVDNAYWDGVGTGVRNPSLSASANSCIESTKFRLAKAEIPLGTFYKPEVFGLDTRTPKTLTWTTLSTFYAGFEFGGSPWITMPSLHSIGVQMLWSAFRFNASCTKFAAVLQPAKHEYDVSPFHTIWCLCPDNDFMAAGGGAAYEWDIEANTQTQVAVSTTSGPNNNQIFAVDYLGDDLKFFWSHFVWNGLRPFADSGAEIDVYWSFNGVVDGDSIHASYQHVTTFPAYTLVTAALLDVDVATHSLVFEQKAGGNGSTLGSTFVTGASLLSYKRGVLDQTVVLAVPSLPSIDPSQAATLCTRQRSGANASDPRFDLIFQSARGTQDTTKSLNYLDAGDTLHPATADPVALIGMPGDAAHFRNIGLI